MEQVPNGTQASNGAKSLTQTPLGSPMNNVSALLLAENPLAWHLQYWLNLGSVAVVRGEDAMLMALRIKMEHTKITDPALKNQLKHAWSQFQRDNQVECVRQWTLMTGDGNDAQPYLCDLDRMLVGKRREARDYLHRIEPIMTTMLHHLHLEDQTQFFEKLNQKFRGLQQDEIMLTDKGRKERDYLRHLETIMINLLYFANVEREERFFEKLGQMYQRLEQEEITGAFTKLAI